MKLTPVQVYIRVCPRCDAICGSPHRCGRCEEQNVAPAVPPDPHPYNQPAGLKESGAFISAVFLSIAVTAMACVAYVGWQGFTWLWERF